MEKTILCVLTSARKQGYTAGLLVQAEESLQKRGYAVKHICLHDYTLSPCKSCFCCIRSQTHACPLPDAFGNNGAGELYRLVDEADGVLIADPVYSFGATASCHLFFERCYPFIWSGRIKGKPLMSISLASNQGMDTFARAEIARLAFTRGFCYMGGIAAHMYLREEIKPELDALLTRFLQAVEVRPPFTDRDKMLNTLGGPYDAFESFIGYLCAGSKDPLEFRPNQALRFHADTLDSQTAELLVHAQQALEKAVQLRDEGDKPKAVEYMVQTNTYWANATWRMFLGKEFQMTAPPGAYKSLQTLNQKEEV